MVQHVLEIVVDYGADRKERERVNAFVCMAREFFTPSLNTEFERAVELNIGLCTVHSKVPQRARVTTLN